LKTNPQNNQQLNQQLNRQFSQKSTTNSRPPANLIRFFPIIILGCALLAVLYWWWLQGQSQPLAGADNPRIRCISYAPFRRPGASPFLPGFNVAKRDIEEDLRIIKKISSCVRTYGISAGLNQVPQVARELGMKVRLGAWLGRDAADNQRELTEAIALTKSHADVVELLIVGNEVLLRKELPPQDLIRLLQQAKTQSTVPVTYADVWEFWRSNPELANHVDNIAIHILPYWEDEPVAAPEAVDHVFSTFAAMQKVFPNKPLWIAETGWPAAGRQRRGALPDAATQISFLNQVTQRAFRESIDVNIIEAFDQPWKRALEGAMGGAWGLFDASGEERAPQKTSLVTDKKWWRGWVGALIGTALAIGIALALGSRLQQYGKVTYLLLGALAGALIPAQIDFIALWSRTTQEALLAGSNALLVTIGSISLLLMSLDNRFSITNKGLLFAWVAMLFFTAATAIVLLADSRYRGFFIALYALPAIVSVAVLPLLSLLRINEYRNQARYLSCILAITALAMLYQEQVTNTQAVILCVYWLCMALPAWLCPTFLVALSARRPADNNAIAQSSGV
jgi:exo-beta-1,3-glucanase (GH17 family)